MKTFEIGDITLIVPEDQLNESLGGSLGRGSYEGAERAAMEKHLVPGDRVLDLGAGAGYISILASRIVGARNVVSVEASPKMQKALHRNLRRNGAGHARVLSGAVVAQAHEEETVRFAVRAAFWASGVTEKAGGDAVEVPALRFGDVMKIARPTFVIMDIEGGELALAGEKWPRTVRMIVMEIHPHLYPPSKIKKLFDELSQAGFALMPWGTRGSVVVLQRVDESQEGD